MSQAATWRFPRAIKLFTARGWLWIDSGANCLLKVCDSDGRLGCQLELDFTKVKVARLRGVGYEVCLTCDYRDDCKDWPAYETVSTLLLCYSRQDQSALAIDLVPLDNGDKKG